MALVERPTSEVVYTMRDVEDSNSRIQIHMPNGGVLIGFGAVSGLDALEAYAVGNFGAWALGGLPLALGAIIDCDIYRASLSQTWYENTFPVGTGEAEQWGVYQFTDANGDYFEVSIPDPPEAILQGNLRYIDSANAAVAAFTAEMLLDAVVNTKAEVVNAQGLKAKAFTEGWKMHSSSQKKGSRATG